MKLSRHMLAPISISVALLGLAGAAQAQSDRGFYIGAGLGSTTLETRQVTSSIPPQTLKVEDSSNSARVFVGYRAFRYLFIEAGAIAYGDLSEQVDPESDEPQVYEASYGGWDLALIANLPLASDAFDIFAKVGVANNEYNTRFFDSVDPSFGADSSSKTSQKTAMYGVGAQFNFGADKQMGLRVEANTYDVSLDATDQRTVLASFVYRF